METSRNPAVERSNTKGHKDEKDKESHQKPNEEYQGMEKRRWTKNRKEINTRIGSTEHGDIQKSGHRSAGHERPQTD